MICIIVDCLSPRFIVEIAVSITKENDFFVFTIKKSKNFIKLMESLNWVAGRSVPG